MSKARIIADYAGTGATSDLATQAELDASYVPQGEPHIIPGVLYPAVADKMLDGTTSLSASTTGPNSSTVASSKYGTVQSDGRMYYYTDIKGSKPIKDPRIGAHFGSQRHTVRSIQLLEQETATQGAEVYSVDGREWFRFTAGSVNTSSMTNGGEGNALTLRGAGETGQFIEIVGYFNQANAYVTWSDNSNARTLIPHINGGGAGTATVQGASANPLTAGNRYVNASSLMNLTFASAITTPGINTLKLTHNNYDTVFGGIELIAQDTTSTANKSKIQIPSQNVVSYGKKFTVSGTPHYNPFATKGDGSASTIPNNTTGDSVATGWSGSTSAYWESTLDTATSLGLGAWEAGSTVYYRPVNGGRIVKWVDSTGTIKTSVNMMPPEAHSITEVNTIADGTAAATGTHNWSTQYQPQFGHKTVGSNLITSWATTSDAVETLDSTGANITQFTNSTGWGTATTNDLGLTVGRLYKIQISNYDHTSGVGLRIFTGTNGTSANGTISVTNLTNDASSSHTLEQEQVIQSYH